MTLPSYGWKSIIFFPLESFHLRWGRGGGGEVVSVLAFYSNNPSSNPAEAYSFFCKIFVWKDKNIQKEAWDGPFKDSTVTTPSAC